ncbi:MAG: DUF4919 domain-containing protein [Cytophagaceae bacterium]|jgi:hypothetical protein|nr:DUF4919 domain-containing protein [Cytophagaceae bacterium]
MRTFLFSIVCSFLSFLGWSQSKDSLLTAIEKKGGYPSLVQRLNASDTSLTKSDFYLIYYGYPTIPLYKPEEIGFQEALLKPYSVAGKHKEVMALADSILRINPVSLTALLEYSYALHSTQQSADAEYYLSRYALFCRLILQSGSGTTDFPYRVNSVYDALEMIAYLKLQSFEDVSHGEGLIEFKLVKNKRKWKSVYFKMPPEGYSIDH